MVFTLVLAEETLSSNQISLRNHVSQWSGWSWGRGLEPLPFGPPSSWRWSRPPRTPEHNFKTMHQIQIPYFIKKGTEAQRGEGTFPIKMSPMIQRNQGIYQRHPQGPVYSHHPDKWGIPRVVQCITCSSVYGSSAHPSPPASHLHVPSSSLILLPRPPSQSDPFMLDSTSGAERP